MKEISKIASGLPLSSALAVDLAAKAQILAGADVINFCVGEPDMKTPTHIAEAGIRAISEGTTRYTNAPGTMELRRAAAGALNRYSGTDYTPEEIAVTTGGKFAVHAALKALTAPGDEVLLPAPYWTSYYHSAVLAGAVSKVIPCRREDGWKLTPELLSEAAGQKAKVLILNNPNNPSGAVYSRRELMALAEVIREKDLYVISDEIYDHCIYTPEPFCSLASLNQDMKQRTVTINGVSKTYAMTGWRIGYAAAPEALIRPISSILSHTTGCPNAAAQAAAVEALTGTQDCTLEMREIFRRRRDLLISGLSEIPGLRFTVPDGAFYLMPELLPPLLSRFHDAPSFALSLLREANVAVVPCDDYGIGNALRLSYTIPDDRIQEGTARIADFIHHNIAK